MHSSELDVAVRAARAGGDVVARSFQRGTAVRSKDVANLVSDADLESERAIIDVISAAFPEHEVFGEESQQGDVAGRDLWIIDPLDGTTNFVHGIPHFAVSVAYYREGCAECGVVFNPIRDDWFLCQRGQGALQNGAPAHVSNAAALNDVLIGVGFYYDRGAMMEATLTAIGDLFRRHIHGIRRFGTASLDLCHVGVGRFGGFFEYELAPWDFAAGRLFVEEAGGRVSTCQGTDLPLAKSSVLATNGRLHEMLLDVVGPYLPHDGHSS